MTTTHKRRTPPAGLRLLGACLIAVMMCMFAGCGASKASTTTCAEFAEMSEAKQDGVLRRLLDEHDKESGVIRGMSNLALLRSQVEVFCGINSMIGQTAAARNQNAYIQDGANWS